MLKISSPSLIILIAASKMFHINMKKDIKIHQVQSHVINNTQSLCTGV